MPALSQHVCFACRKVFKKPHFYSFLYPKEKEKKAPVYSCPECHAPMTYMGYKFRAPASAAIKAWKKIEDGVKLGTDWTVPTKRKEKPKPTISRELKKALGIPKKMKRPANQPVQTTAMTHPASATRGAPLSEF